MKKFLLNQEISLWMVHNIESFSDIYSHRPPNLKLKRMQSSVSN